MLRLAGCWHLFIVRDCAINPISIVRALYFAFLAVTLAH